MPPTRTAAVATSAVALFGLFLFTGSAWVAVTQFIPAGLPQKIAVIAVGFLFAMVFLVGLANRVRKLSSKDQRVLWRDISLSVLDVLLLLLAFAFVYSRFGITDTTLPNNPVVGGPDDQSWESYAKCVYFSFVTFTTLGYGDFQPRGFGRVMVCLQAFIGYLVLGVLASTSAQLISRDEKSH